MNKRTVIITVSVSVILIALTVTALLIISPLMSGKYLKNTADALFFDLSSVKELLARNSLDYSCDLYLPTDITELSGDITLKLDSSVDAERDLGKVSLIFGFGEDRSAVSISHDPEQFLIGFDNNTPVNFPRKDVKEKLDASMIAPGSASVHALGTEAYNTLISFLESSSASMTEDELYASIEEELSKTIKPKSSLLFSKGKLCRKVTYELGSYELGQIIDVIYISSGMTSASPSEAIKEAIGKRKIVISFITDGNYITSASVTSSDGERIDIEFVYGTACGFDAVSNGNRVSYRKEKTDTSLAVEITLTPSEGDPESLSLIGSKSDSSYTLSLNGEAVASGIFKVGENGLELTANDKDNRSLLALSMRADISEDIILPQAASIIDMDKGEITAFVRSISIKHINALLEETTGLNVGQYITADGKLMLYADKVMTEASKLYAPYISLLKTVDKKIRNTVSKIYIWNDRLDAYILFTYSIKEDTLAIGCAYELTEEIIAEYHTAHIGENRIMYAHSIKKIENVEPTCEEAGREVYKCEYCDYGYENDFVPLGHDNIRLPENAFIHDGSPTTAVIERCERCGIISRLWARDYNYIELTPDQNGGYTISNFEAQSSPALTYLCLASLTDFEIRFSGISVKQADGEFEAINIPEGIERLKASSIFLSSEFKILVLPSTLKVIESSAFYGNGKPSVIFYSGNEEDWGKIKLNGYSSLWADTEIIFCPKGATHEEISKKLFLSYDIEKAVTKQKNMILNIDAARELAKRGSVSIISEGKIAFAAYDEESSLVAYCGTSTGILTRIEIYDIKAGKLVASFDVYDYIHTLDIREGYVAMGAKMSHTIYVYNISTGEIKKVEADPTFDAGSSVTQVCIDSGYVYACTSSRSCSVIAYSIESGELKTIVHASSLELIPLLSHHRIIAVEKYYSKICFNLIDTEKADYLKELTYAENTISSLVEIPYFENVIVTDLGEVYDLDGNPTDTAPDVPLKATIPEGLPTVSEFYKSDDGVMTLFAESGQKVLLALQNASSSEPLILDYYAEEAFVTAEGDMIIYTPGNYGLLLVKLN